MRTQVWELRRGVPVLTAGPAPWISSASPSLPSACRQTRSRLYQFLIPAARPFVLKALLFLFLCVLAPFFC